MKFCRQQTLLGAVLLLLAAVSTYAQTDYVSDYGNDFGQPEKDFPELRLGLVAEDDTGVLPVGIPFSQLMSEEFGEPAAPYSGLFREQRISVDPKFKLGGARFNTRLLEASAGPELGVPFLNGGFAPTDGYQLKIGPLYGRVGSVSFLFLASDNVNQVDENGDRESGAISVAEMALEARLQLTEGLFVDIGGSLIWLPFENEIGFAGFGMDDNFNAAGQLGYQTLSVDASYSFLAAGWDVTVAGGFRGDERDYRAQWKGTVALWEGTSFDEEDRAGVYIFGGSGEGASSAETEEFGETFSSDDEDYEWSVWTSVRASRDIPMHQSVYARVELARNDTFTDDDGYFLVDTTEQLNVTFTSERENTRFQPFATYSLTRSYDNRSPDHEQHYWSHSLRVGVTGPVTENIFLYADFGYELQENHRSDLEDSESELYRVGLTHRINPMMGHAFEAGREIDDDLRISDRVRYSWYYRVAKDVRVTFAFIERHAFNRNDDSDQYWEQIKEVAVIYDVSTKTSVMLQFNQRDIRRADGGGEYDEYEQWEAIATVSHRLTESVQVELRYSHTEEEQGTTGSRFTENLVTLMIRKDFRAPPGYRRPGY